MWIDLWLTCNDPCMTFDPRYELRSSDSSDLICWSLDISKQINLWLTPADRRLTFDPAKYQDVVRVYPTKLGGHIWHS